MMRAEGDVAAGPPETASALAGAVARGERSAVEITRAALDRIADADGEIAAFCTIDAGQALAEAEDVDRRLAAGERAGPLAGVPVAIKDLIPTKGLRTTYGSALYADHVPEQDEVCVAKLRRAGAVIIGKTNASEFGYGPLPGNRLFPPTRNPWNPALTPGGSSAGSAAAVAAGMTPLAIGSDGGGSIRVPAALCGVVGFKPTMGRAALYPSCRDETAPGVSGWESLEHVGPLARTVADAALGMAVIAGPDARDRFSLPDDGTRWDDLDWTTLRGCRIAFSPDLGFAAVDPEVAAIAGGAAERLAAALCCDLEHAAPALGEHQRAFEAIVAMETDRTGLRRLATELGASFDAALTAVLDRVWTADEFTDAIMRRKHVARAMAAFLFERRFMLTPTTAVAAFAFEQAAPAVIAGRSVPASAWTPFSALANLAGLPAISAPAGLTADGRPVGLQIVGRRFDDIGVLRAAAAFEAAAPWPATAASYAQAVALRD